MDDMFAGKSVGENDCECERRELVGLLLGASKRSPGIPSIILLDVKSPCKKVKYKSIFSCPFSLCLHVRWSSCSNNILHSMQLCEFCGDR